MKKLILSTAVALGAMMIAATGAQAEPGHRAACDTREGGLRYPCERLHS